MSLQSFDKAQLAEFRSEIEAKYQELKARDLHLDLTRGKPSSEQLDFSNDLLSLPGEEFRGKNGTDYRNYGGLDGIAEIRELWAELLGLPADQVIAGDASSLNMQFDLISWAYIWGTNDSERPWKDEPAIKWLCPVPGYDRHFTITEHFGFEMIPVPLTEEGPDLEVVRELVQDPQVKGMWSVPIFGNPTGMSYSERVVKELAAMPTAAPDFRIMWDNAYAVHTLTNEFPEVLNVVELAEQAGNPNRFWFLSSTSKITFAGAGVAFLASSLANLEWYSSHAQVRGIGPNKLNQLAHAKFFGDAEGVRIHMRKHAGSLAPKFEKVLDILENRLGEYGVATWTKPEGGYFISVDVLEHTAARVVALAKEAGIALTGSGSSFPLHNDPKDQNIRLAPSLPPVDELEVAMDGFATCVLLAAVEKLSA